MVSSVPTHTQKKTETSGEQFRRTATDPFPSQQKPGYWAFFICCWRWCDACCCLPAAPSLLPVPCVACAACRLPAGLLLCRVLLLCPACAPARLCCWL